MRSTIALMVAGTICAVLLLVVADLILAAGVSTGDRAASLAALAAIGLVLARGLARYLDRDDD